MGLRDGMSLCCLFSVPLFMSLLSLVDIVFGGDLPVLAEPRGRDIVLGQSVQEKRTCLGGLVR